MKIGILGSGALGLTAAYELLKKGHQVTVLEKETSVGGLVTSYKIGESYFEKFYHHIFQSDKEIIKLIDEVNLTDKLIWQPGKTGTFYQGKIYRLDSPFTVLKFSPLSLLGRIRMGLGLAYLKSVKGYSRFENVTAATWLKRVMGDEVYRIIWEPLLKGKFQDEYDKITMSWFWARVYARTSKLGYLKNGFYQLYQSLEAKIKDMGGEILLGEEVTEIGKENEGIKVITNKKRYSFDKVLVTLPTNLFFKLTPGLGQDFKEKYHWDDYFGAQTLVLTLKKKLTDYYWVNISDREFPFLVFVEHTNLMPISDYDNSHLIYLGNYLSTLDPRFKMSESETFEKYFPYLKKLNPNFERDWVTGFKLFRAPFAQPLVKIGFKDHIPPHETGIPNLYLANMAQVYPWDRGQNYSINLAKEVVEEMTAGK